MIVTATLLLVICALIALVAHAVKPNVPLWVAVLFVIVVQLLSVVPK